MHLETTSIRYACPCYHLAQRLTSTTQMSQAFTPPSLNFAANQTGGGHNNYFPMISQADPTDNDRSTNHLRMDPPMMMAANTSRSPMANVGGQYNAHAHMLPGGVTAARSPDLNVNYHSFVSDANSLDMSSSHTPHAAVMPLPNYGGAQGMTRNGSMTSNNSQMTYSSPMTPMTSHVTGLDSAQRSPFNFGTNDRSPVTNGLPSFQESAATIQSKDTEMGYDGQNDMLDLNVASFGENMVSNGDHFAQDLFY